jgi:hypothetical protein
VYIKDHARTVIVLATAVALVAGGASSGSTIGASTGGPGASVSTEIGVRVNAKARDRSSRSVVQRLERRGLRIRTRLELGDDDCAAHSYGDVQSWFRSNPCAALYRSIFEVRDQRGGLVLVAVAWVDMPSEAQAVELQRLLDKSGTGNVVELNREGGRYRDVRFTGQHYVSRREGTTVINAQAEPVDYGAQVADLTDVVRSAVG